MTRQGLFEWSNMKLGLLKWGLIIFNVAFWCLGVVSLAIGLWLYIENNEFATLSDGRNLVGSVFLIAVGFGVVIVGFLGIVAAVWESTIIATVFGVMVSLSLGMYLTSGVWSLIKNSQVEDDVRTSLASSASFFETNAAYSSVWNTLHSRYNCCGITTPNDWITYNIIPSNRPPPSCCPSLTSTTGAAGAEVGRTQCDRNQAFSRGCVQPLAAYEERQYSIMGPIGLAFGLFQIFGLVLCILFCASVNKGKDSYNL